MQNKPVRTPLVVPAVLHSPDGALVGTVERLETLRAVIQSPGALPTAGQECPLVLELPLGSVRIHARVLGADPATRRFEVELRRIEENGRLLIAAQLFLGDPEGLPGAS